MICKWQICSKHQGWRSYHCSGPDQPTNQKQNIIVHEVLCFFNSAHWNYSNSILPSFILLLQNSLSILMPSRNRYSSQTHLLKHCTAEARTKIFLFSELLMIISCPSTKNKPKIAFTSHCVFFTRMMNEHFHIEESNNMVFTSLIIFYKARTAQISKLRSDSLLFSSDDAKNTLQLNSSTPQPKY